MTPITKEMATKILINTIGQQLIADVKQVENKETKEVVGYWLTSPRTVNYDQNEDGSVAVNFGTYCLVSSDTEFSVRAESIVSILEPRDEVIERYNLIVNPEPDVEVDAPNVDLAEVGEAVAESV